MALHTIESHCCNKTFLRNVDKQKRVLTAVMGNVDEVVSGTAGCRLSPQGLVLCIAFIPEQVSSSRSQCIPQQPRLCSEEQVASCLKNPSQTPALNLWASSDVSCSR